jgi:hypothetical protein
MKKTIATGIAIIALCIACEHESITPEIKEGSYFPHTPGSRWKYEQIASCGWPMEDEICRTTMWGVAGPEIYDHEINFDTAFEAMMSPTTMMQFIKVDGSEYYAGGWYMMTTKFLDDNLEVGATWTGGQIYIGSILTITEKNVTKTVRGRKYRNVIVVTEEINSFGTASTTTHYYARGVGEIYMKKHHVYEDGRTDTWEYELVEYFIAPK